MACGGEKALRQILHLLRGPAAPATPQLLSGQCGSACRGADPECAGLLSEPDAHLHRVRPVLTLAAAMTQQAL